MSDFLGSAARSCFSNLQVLLLIFLLSLTTNYICSKISLIFSCSSKYLVSLRRLIFASSSDLVMMRSTVFPLSLNVQCNQSRLHQHRRLSTSICESYSQDRAPEQTTRSSPIIIKHYFQSKNGICL